MNVFFYKGSKGKIEDSFNLQDFTSKVAELKFNNPELSEYCATEIMVYLNKKCSSKNFECYELTNTIIEKMESDFFDKTIFSEEVKEEIKSVLKKIGSASRYITNWRQERVYIGFK